jgi:dephospho-CoA kinase
MKLLGLTGGIGTGKTTASDWFRRHGIEVIDTDVVARDIVKPGQPALAEIAARFGSTVLDADGTLRRDVLAKAIFSDPQARQDLEAILHPRIRAVWQGRVAEWRAAGKKAAVVVIPLLFETKATGFDATLCMACTAKTQERRLLARGWSPEQSAQRVSAQLPMEKKMALSDYVVWTEGALAASEGQLQRILITTGFKFTDHRQQFGVSE